MSVYLSVRLEQLGSNWTDFLSVFFENLSRKFKFNYNLKRITGTSHEDQCKFLITSRLILLRIRNVSDKICRENQDTHFVFNNFFFPKILLFMR